jgi:LacI family transcriptional regulator
MAQRITMSDVAREAGVSLMTVSRVVNDKGEISPETRERVQEVIEKLGYRPSGIARSLAGGQTYTIGLVVPDIANPYFSGMAHGVTSVANAEGFGVLLCDCEEASDRELTMLDVLEEKRVDGVVVAAPRTSTDELLPVLARHPNAVVVNRLFLETDAATAQGYVINDDKSGGYAITKHFLDQGHTTIGFLAGPSTSYGSMRRMIGYRKALDEYGLDYDPEIVRYCVPTVEGGRAVASQLIQERPEISALFCFNDLVAIGVLQCCHQLGKRVPGDLAIFGYDDIPMASWVTPSLSTCRVNFEEMGRDATKLLISHISECPDECTNIVMQPKLIIRDSAP